MKNAFFAYLDTFDPSSARLTVEIFQDELTEQIGQYNTECGARFGGICDAVSATWVRVRRDSFPDAEPARLAVCRNSLNALTSLQHIITDELDRGNALIEQEVIALRSRINSLSDDDFQAELSRISRLRRDLDQGIKGKILVDQRDLAHAYRASFENLSFEKVDFDWLSDPDTYYYVQLKVKPDFKETFGPCGHALALYTGISSGNPFDPKPAMVDANTGEIEFDCIETTRRFATRYLELYRDLMGTTKSCYYCNIYEIKSTAYVSSLS